MTAPSDVGLEVPDLRRAIAGQYGSILIDPPWRFANRTGKAAPSTGGCGATTR